MSGRHQAWRCRKRGHVQPLTWSASVGNVMAVLADEIPPGLALAWGGEHRTCRRCWAHVACTAWERVWLGMPRAEGAAP